MAVSKIPSSVSCNLTVAIVVVISYLHHRYRCSCYRCRVCNEWVGSGIAIRSSASVVVLVRCLARAVASSPRRARVLAMLSRLCRRTLPLRSLSHVPGARRVVTVTAATPPRPPLPSLLLGGGLRRHYSPLVAQRAEHARLRDAMTTMLFLRPYAIDGASSGDHRHHTSTRPATDRDTNDAAATTAAAAKDFDHKCWSCDHFLKDQRPLFCGTCHIIQRPPADLDFFALFGLYAHRSLPTAFDGADDSRSRRPRSYDISLPRLEKAYTSLQREVHPDLFSRKSSVRALSARTHSHVRLLAHVSPSLARSLDRLNENSRPSTPPTSTKPSALSRTRSSVPSIS